MADVRVLFGQVADDYLVMASHLRPTARIVHTPVFDAALVKICNSTKLTASELRAVQRFIVQLATVSGKKKGRTTSDYASEILRGGKQRRVAGAATVSIHELAKVVPPTSNTVEQLSPQCKLVLTPQRTCMLPATFEMLVFLRVNRDL